jgi:hypothetical protein
MRYTYLIKDQSGKEEEYKAMSYRKLLKKLSSKYSNQLVKIKYINKHNNELIKLVNIKEIE